MLSFITNDQDPLLDFVKDDPVRPEIPKEFRVGPGRFVSALVDGDNPSAMVCVNLLDFVPADVADLGKQVEEATTAVFYTIWSYAPGAGARLLQETVRQIKEQFPTVNTFVTLSPKTELARKFHLKNGASIHRENESTVNYLYNI
jgi:Malonyl-CoA decarboxylase C-terminal domain